MQLNMGIALAHAIVRSSGIATRDKLPHSGAYREINRAIFQKLAAYWMIPLQSSNGARWKKYADNREPPVGLKPSAIPCRIQFLEPGVK
jgi:hypothetical protein